jgi:NitT/TauT family transport system substrate-binding protein
MRMAQRAGQVTNLVAGISAVSLRLAVAVPLLGLPLVQPARAETPVKFVMDWAFEGAQSIWTLAAETGCFKEKGLAVTIDRGFGSGDAISKVASGAYDVGVSDFSTLIDFDGKHSDQPLIATLVVSDRSPTSVLTLKKSGISKPQDLAGKRVADPVGEASRVLFPAFAKANGLDPASITWVSVAPNLRQATLVQGQADAAAGHMFTVLTGLRALGVKDEDVTIMRYSDWGVNLLGNSVVTKPAWAAAHPDAMKGFVACAVAGVKASIADPKAAIASLKKFNSLVDDATEMAALDFSTNGAILTPAVLKSGMSQVTPERLDAVLTQVSDALGMAKPPAAEIWTAAYLPPAAELMLTK